LEVVVQIIIVDRRFAQARTLDVSRKTLVLATVGGAFGVLLAVIGLYAVTFRVGAGFKIPVLHDIVSFIMRDEVARHEQFTRDNVAAMARKLGEMQAQLLRLDALGERVSKVAGIRPEEFDFREIPGRGGAIPTDARAITLAELQAELDRSAKSVEQRADYMNVIESELMSGTVRRALLPQNTPVSEGFVGSSFGMRTDPFTGQYAMHAGIDFAAPVGTAIFAAAGGVVVSAEMHPAYGNTVEIDHGNDLRTLYAHASRIDVKPGDLVKRGQRIGSVGTTGRSTGPHLHFEVHHKGVPQNPAKFLASLKPGSPLASLGARTERNEARVNVRALAESAQSAKRPAAVSAQPASAPAAAAEAPQPAVAPAEPGGPAAEVASSTDASK
jgi:murein DD-endopeptidase MepM/ murein hydrolase activator NlpD